MRWLLLVLVLVLGLTALKADAFLWRRNMGGVAVSGGANGVLGTGTSSTDCLGTGTSATDCLGVGQ